MMVVEELKESAWFLRFFDDGHFMSLLRMTSIGVIIKDIKSSTTFIFLFYFLFPLGSFAIGKICIYSVVCIS